MLKALRNRNYRLYFFGQLISLIGSWMQVLAISLLVYQVTKSPIMLGYVAFSSQISVLIITPFIGVYIDKWDLRKLILTTQFLFMILAFIISYLAYNNLMTGFYLIILSLLTGLITSFDMPARQSFVVHMVENKEDLANAIALNSTLFNSARFVGPAIAGILIAAVGEWGCFLINGISYIAVIIALLLMNVKMKNQNTKKNSPFLDFREGIDYVIHMQTIKYILLLISLVSFTGVSASVLMPVFVKDILKGNAATQGFLTSCVAVGAIIASVYLASRQSPLGLLKYLPISITIISFGLAFFSYSSNIYISYATMILLGFAMTMMMISCNTIIQTIVDDDKRGRVMSLYTTSFFGTTPFGSLVTGILAGLMGAKNTILIFGLLCLAGGFIFAGKIPVFKKIIKPIYEKNAIINKIN